MLPNILHILSVALAVLTCSLPLLFRLFLVRHDTGHDSLIVLSQLEMPQLPLGAHFNHVLVSLDDGIALQLGRLFTVPTMQQQSLVNTGGKLLGVCVCVCVCVQVLRAP